MKKRRVGLVSVVLMLAVLLLSVLGCADDIGAPTATPELTIEPTATVTKPEVIHTAEEIEEELIWWLDNFWVAGCVRFEPDCNPDPVAVLHMRTELPSALRASRWWYEEPEYPTLNQWAWTITAAVEVPVKFPYGSEPYTWDYAKDGGSYITKTVFLSWWDFDEAPGIPLAENEDTSTYRRWLTGESYFRPTDQMMLDWFRQGTHH